MARRGVGSLVRARERCARMVSVGKRCVAISALAMTGALGGCIASRQSVRADFRPAMRYPFDPPRVHVVQTPRGPALLDASGTPVARPWAPVATYTASAPAPAPDVARALGCDAYATRGDDAGASPAPGVQAWRETTVRGMSFAPGEHVCIQYADAAAQEQRRREEGAWVWTAYQRPPFGSGWSVNLHGALWPFGGSGIAQQLPFFGLSIDKYFRALPLGLGLRLGAGVQSTVLLPGLAVYVPVIAAGRVQLTAMGGAEYAIVPAHSGMPTQHGLRAGAGGYVDLLLGRTCCSVGAGFEYWFLGEREFRTGPAIMARVGFPL